MLDDKLVRYTVFYDKFKYFVCESSVFFDDVARYLILLAACNEHALWDLSFFFIHGETFPSGPEPPYCRGFAITLLYTSHSVGFLWTSDTPTQQTLPDNKQHSQQTDIHALGCFRTHYPNKREAADRRLRPRGHRDRLRSVLWGWKWPVQDREL